MLTGKYRRGEPAPPGRARKPTRSERPFHRVEALERFAKRAVSLLELAIGWLRAAGPVVSVITGATKPEQIQANAAAGTWEPSVEDVEALRAERGVI